MKKNSILNQSPKRATSRNRGPMTIGMDLGDKNSRYCLLGEDNEVAAEGSVPTTKKGLLQKFGAETLPHRHGSGNTLALGESAVEQAGLRGDCSQCTAGTTDQRQQPQRRPAGRADTGAAGASGSGVVATHPASP